MTRLSFAQPTADDVVLRDFEQAQRRRGLRATTIEQRRYKLRKFSAWLGQSVLSATSNDVESWLDTISLHPVTRYGCLSHLHTFYAFAIREGFTTVDPTLSIQRPRMRQRIPNPVHDDDLTIAFAAATPTMFAKLALMAFAGLRCGGVAGLDREDLIDGANPPVIAVRDRGPRRGAKGGYEYVVPMHGIIMPALRAVGLPRHGPIFTKLDGSPCSGGYISREVNAFLHDLGVESSAQKIRAWYATNLPTDDLHVVQEALGHRNINNTLVYRKLKPRRVADVVTAMPTNVLRAA